MKDQEAGIDYSDWIFQNNLLDFRVCKIFVFNPYIVLIDKKSLFVSYL